MANKYRYVQTQNQTEDGKAIYHRLHVEPQRGRPKQFVKVGGKYKALHG